MIRMQSRYFIHLFAKGGFPFTKLWTFSVLGGAQFHSIAFGGVFPNITEAILVDEISTKVRIYPPKVITKSKHQIFLNF